ncbi:MAG: transposase [Desulfobacterales bacterium]|jgi:REP element-mobilizing transposase RayT
MARPLRITYPGAFYHVTSRGNEKKPIFKSLSDREKFLFYLESATRRYEAIIHAYCLMGNHYHLLLETPSGNLSQIMHHINGAYTTYFNTKRQRAGHLLQGRFKAILVDMDEYSKELSRYIHLNPIRAKIVDKLQHYRWSSYLDYIGKRKPPAWLERDFILGYFGKKTSIAEKNYREFIDTKLGQKCNSPLTDVVGSAVLGSADFVSEIKKRFIEGKKTNRDLPAIRALSSKPRITEIIKEVESAFNQQPAQVKNVALYLCHRHTAGSLKQIGRHFNIGESAVSQASRRFGMKIKRDKKLSKKIKSVENSLNLSKM